MEERRTGAFTSLADFAARVNPRAINKRVIESLAAAGAFDTLESTAPVSSPARMRFSPPASAAMKR